MFGENDLRVSHWMPPESGRMELASVCDRSMYGDACVMFGKAAPSYPWRETPSFRTAAYLIAERNTASRCRVVVIARHRSQANKLSFDARVNLRPVHAARVLQIPLITTVFEDRIYPKRIDFHSAIRPEPRTLVIAGKDA